MAFRFYIASQLTDQPVNNKDLITSILRDRNLNSLLVTQDVELIYNANLNLNPGEVSGFALIKNLFDTGTCQEAVIEIYDELSQSETVKIYTGVVKITQVSIDHQRQLLKFKIEDNNYYSYIKNNQNIEYNVQSIKTKNREDITPPQIYEVDVFSSASGVYGSSISEYCRGYRVYDVFRFLIAAISDNKIGFESVYLQQHPELFIFDGFSLINKNTDPTVKTSFNKLYSEIHKARNITFYVDSTNPNSPVLRLESPDSLYSSLQLLSFDDIKELTSRVITDKIYSVIKVGAQDNPGGAAAVYTFNSGTSYLGWMIENYTPLGQCNIDNEFNLVNEYGITSNDVNDQINGAVNSDVDKMFLIECENVDTVNFTANAIAYPSWVGTAVVLYNQGLNNPSKLLIHGSNYQTGLTNTLQIGSNGFQAALGQDTLIGQLGPAGDPLNAGIFPGLEQQPMVFADETTGNNYDGGANYDNILGYYDVPVDGIYSFVALMGMDFENFFTCTPQGNGTFITITGSPPGTSTPNGAYLATIGIGANIILRIRAYTDNTYTTLIQESFTQGDFFVSPQLITTSLTAFLPIGAAVIVSKRVYIGRYVQGNLTSTSTGQVFPPIGNGNVSIDLLNSIGWNISVSNCSFQSSARPAVYARADSTFLCNGSPDGGGITIENDPRLYKDKEYEFSFNIPVKDWQNIKLNPTGMFRFEKDGVVRFGWIQSMRHNDFTGETQIKLITQDATII